MLFFARNVNQLVWYTLLISARGREGGRDQGTKGERKRQREREGERRLGRDGWIDGAKSSLWKQVVMVEYKTLHQVML